MEQQNRIILPTFTDTDTAYLPLTISPDFRSGKDWHLRKRRRTGGPGVRVACNNCRAKKAACDGNRPNCHRCVKSQVSCEYISTSADETIAGALKRRLAEVEGELEQHMDIVKHLRSIPEDEVLVIVRRLRSTSRVSEVLASIRNRVPPMRPSDMKTACSLFPAEYDIEFELAVRHGKVYPALPPLDLASIDQDDFFQPGSRHSRQSIASLITDQEEFVEGCSERELSYPGHFGSRSYTSLRGSTVRLPLAGPHRTQAYCDSRLHDLTVNFWTAVPIANEFAASAISMFLENENPLLGFFDVDLFLADLVDCHLGYCTSFLVSSVLCLATQCYAGFDSRASSFSISFHNEAEWLWQQDRASDSIITLAAMTTLCAASTWQGKERLALELLVDVREMAERLSLLGLPHTTQLVESFQKLGPESLKATAHVAWGTYCWLSLHAIYYRDEPIAFPPALPIPGQTNGSKFDTSKSSQIPLPLPIYMGRTFPAICSYWTIIEEVHSIYFGGNKEDQKDEVPLEVAEEKYKKLLAWAENLTKDLARTERNPHVSTVHALYHIAVLDIFRPFLDRPGSRHLRVGSFASADSSPCAIFNASLNQLKRLVLEYWVWYDPQFYGPIFSAAVMHVNCIVVRDISKPDWRFYFLLCMSFWKGAIVRHACVGTVAQATLCVAMNAGSIKGEKAEAIMMELERKLRYYQLSDVAVSCVVDFDEPTNTGSSRANELVEQFDELILLDEITTGLS